jgi:SAM-dependent methyltransferase/glycosyltransferase involved in cell wall biosynthesis
MYPPPQIFDLLPRIPLSARTVLEVGCGSGDLMAAYRRFNPKARLLGIEPDVAAAATARRHMDQVVSTDAEAEPLPFALPDGIDCIIYNAILEHLWDPWALVRRHAEVLNPDGVMVICVPNIDYWRRTERRLRGIWDDGPVGQPAYLAAAWLNLDGMTRQLAGAGLVLCDVTALEPDGQSACDFGETLAPSLAALGIDPAGYTKRAAASHLILRARREPVEQLVLAGTMLDPVGGVSHVRVVHPLQAVGTDPGVSTSVTDRIEGRQPGDRRPRIFVLHRPALVGERGLETVRMLTDAGYLVVTEFDDHPDHFDMMRAGGILTFTGVHALQTSTTALAEVLRLYNPEVAVFPNAVVSLPEAVNFADPGCTTLFFGALNRERDWQVLMPAINAVASRAGDRLKFQIVHDRGFFDALQTPHKTFTPTCDYETYMRILAGSEISFMPLSDTPFNRTKSDLKFIEAGSHRVAALASTVVYGNSIEDGRTGLLFRDPVEFEARLLRLVAMPELARDLGDAAQRYVADSRMLAYQVAPRIRWYRSLWARRDVLTKALLARSLRPAA